MLIDDQTCEIIGRDGKRTPAPPGLSLTHHLQVHKRTRAGTILQAVKRKEPLYATGRALRRKGGKHGD